jgi:hypothetical protein
MMKLPLPYREPGTVPVYPKEDDVKVVSMPSAMSEEEKKREMGRQAARRLVWRMGSVGFLLMAAIIYLGAWWHEMSGSLQLASFIAGVVFVITAFAVIAVMHEHKI